MDEPFGALDAFTRDEMNLELQRVWSQRRKTVLFITHSIQESIFLSDRVAVLSSRPSKVDNIFTIELQRPLYTGYALHRSVWSLQRRNSRVDHTGTEQPVVGSCCCRDLGD